MKIKSALLGVAMCSSVASMVKTFFAPKAMLEPCDVSRVNSVVQPSAEAPPAETEEVANADPKAGSSRKGSRKSSKDSKDRARGSNEKDVPGSSSGESFGAKSCLASWCFPMVFDFF